MKKSIKGLCDYFGSNPRTLSKIRKKLSFVNEIFYITDKLSSNFLNKIKERPMYKKVFMARSVDYILISFRW